MDCRTFEGIAAAAADEQLADDERIAVEAHLADCPRCRAELETQRAVRGLLRARRRPVPVAAELREEIIRRSTAPPRHVRSAWRRRAVLAGSLAAALLLGFAWFLRSAPSPLLTVAERDVAAAEAGELSLAMRTNDAAALRGYYRDAGITFAHSADDLEAQGLQLVGGTVSSIGTAVTTRTLYTGPQGVVVCRRFRSGSVALPSDGKQVGPSRVFERNGIRVAVTPVGDDVICSMASRLATASTAAAAPIALARRD